MRAQDRLSGRGAGAPDGAAVTAAEVLALVLARWEGADLIGRQYGLDTVTVLTHYSPCYRNVHFVSGGVLPGWMPVSTFRRIHGNDPYTRSDS